MKEWMQNFLETQPLYTNVKITFDQFIDLMGLKGLSITQFCSCCGKKRTFKYDGHPFIEIENEYDELPLTYDSSCGYDFAEEYSNAFLFPFSCQHDCGEIHYITLQIENFNIRKIGQYPTFIQEEVKGNLLKYKSLISEYYPELTKAVLSYSQNMGVASFVYLRRILEHLIEKKYEQYDEETAVKLIDKLKILEKYEKVIPNEFEEIKNQIYTVLSKGVHDYEESECLTLFPIVKFIIESILDEELAKREKAKKVQEAKKIIQEKLKAGEKKDDRKTQNAING